MSQLTLPETLFLLALHEDKGKIHDSVAMSLHYGLSGAILADLALLNRLEIDNKGKIIFLDAVPTGDNLLDESFNKIKDTGKTYKTQHWVEEFSHHFRKLQKRISENMVTKGVLKVEDEKYLWVIPYQANPQINASARYLLKNHLREILLANGSANDFDVVLLQLIRTCCMLQYVVTGDEQKMARRKIETLINQENNGKAVIYAVEIIKSSAVTAATIASIG